MVAVLPLVCAVRAVAQPVVLCRVAWVSMEQAGSNSPLRAAFRAGTRRRGALHGIAALIIAVPMAALGSPWLHANKERVVEAATRVRMPTIYEHADFVRIGGLVSYGPDMHVVFRTAATYVDKILKGAPPATLPVEQIRKIELVINTKTAKALDLAIPQSVLLRADEVIQ